MHLRAAGIYKISGGLGGPRPLADFYVLGWRLGRYAEISGWLEPCYTFANITKLTFCEQKPEDTRR